MKRNWTIEELIEHWTLLPPELALVGNKTGPTRLGFALLLKFLPSKPTFQTLKTRSPGSWSLTLPSR